MRTADDGRVGVCIRVREAPEGQHRIVVSVLDNVVILHDPRLLEERCAVARDTTTVVQSLEARNTAGRDGAVRQGRAIGAISSPSASIADFDQCLVSMSPAQMMEMPAIKHSDFLQPPSYASQEDVYQAVAAPAVRAAVDGVHSCVLAYGQTGSGKTYSLFGNPSAATTHRDPGVVPRAIEDLFGLLAAEKSRHASNPAIMYRSEVQLSFYELYQSEISCLISKRCPLRVSIVDGHVR